MKRFFTLLAALVMLLSSACAQELQTLFTASAGAPFDAQADGAVITLRVSAREETLAEAETKAAESVDALKYALLSAGAQAAEIAIARSDVQAEHEYHYNKLQEPELVLIGRSVEYTLTVTVTDREKLNAFLDAAVNSGLYASYEVEQTALGYDEAYRLALAEAAKTAVEKAAALAKACGFESTEIISVTELPCERTDGLSGLAQVEVTLGAAK